MLKMLCDDIAVEICCHVVLLSPKADIHFSARLPLLKRAILKAVCISVGLPVWHDPFLNGSSYRNKFHIL